MRKPTLVHRVGDSLAVSAALVVGGTADALPGKDTVDSRDIIWTPDGKYVRGELTYSSAGTTCTVQGPLTSN